MIDNKILKEIVKKLKTLLKENKKSLYKVKDILEKEYERISDREDGLFAEKYSIEEIIQSKTIKKIKKHNIINKKTIVIEIVEYPVAENGIVIIYNYFNNSYWPSELAIYETKQKV